MQLAAMLRSSAVLWHLTVFAVWHVELAAGVAFHGFPIAGPRAHYDDPPCICSDIPILTSPAPVLGFTTTTPPPAPVEVITSDIKLANKVWQDPVGLATEIAQTMGIAPAKVVVVPKSWGGAQNPGPLFTDKPKPKGVGFLSRQQEFYSLKKKCDCKKTELRPPLPPGFSGTPPGDFMPLASMLFAWPGHSCSTSASSFRSFGRRYGCENSEGLSSVHSWTPWTGTTALPGSDAHARPMFCESAQITATFF